MIISGFFFEIVTSVILFDTRLIFIGAVVFDFCFEDSFTSKSKKWKKIFQNKKIKTFKYMRNFYTLKRGFFIPVVAALFFQFLVGGHQAISQGLTGTYTIGAGGDYATFTGAVTSLNSNGVSGPVIFNVEDGTYNEQIVIGPITGSSLSNTITFQSQSGNATNVVLTHAAVGVNDNYTILLENASHFIVKNLTIKAALSEDKWNFIIFFLKEMYLSLPSLPVQVEIGGM
jgi:hypothetical protein